ncbi:RrF2 family transcriptional regulator [Riemerella columbina]|uniref:RrF2 family transcriptional regulator n=1 Tax=Riemerella columbina TaxID=103810 RepID=UPI00267011F4|nr:Rrf2 family transcriptional regulator [Riemerella columbina]WKS96013.1 Rrf2 family transcriptional regulator [Riemerella columbina]
MFSKACEYAIRSAIYVAQKSLGGERVNVKEVAKEVDAPEAFTAKILQQLCKAQLLDSVRGQQGGFMVQIDQLQHISIYHIIIAIDGDTLFTQCGLGLKRCSSANPCPVHNDFKALKNKLKHLTQQYSLYDLAVKTEQGLAWLKI